MKNRFCISVREHKSLLFTTLLAFSILVSSFFVLSVESYNSAIETAEVEKQYIADNGSPSPQYNICNFGTTYPDIWSRFHSFFCLPLIYLALRKNKTWWFALSFSFSLIPLFNFVLWLSKTRGLKFYRDLPSDAPLLVNSNSFDSLVFFLISLLAIWQAVILFRMLLKAIRYE